MANIITSKTRRSSTWKRGRSADVQQQTRDVERRNTEKAEDYRDARIKKVINDWDCWDGKDAA